jgi:hypothetical protein
LLRRQVRVWLRETATFVDNCKLLHDIVVESIKHDQDDTTTRWEAQQSVFGEAICLQLAVFERTDLVLVLFGIAIERREIEV